MKYETMHVVCMVGMNLEQGNVLCALSMGCQDGVCTRSAGNQTEGRGIQRGEYVCVYMCADPAGISTSSQGYTCSAVFIACSNLLQGDLFPVCAQGICNFQ